MAVEISIGGQVVIIPGVYVTTTVAPVPPSGLLPTGPLVFLAAGYGGVPFVPTNYTSAQTLQAAMRGSPSSDLVPFMFNPSSQVNGTSLVTYINVAPNTQSSATIVSSGGTGVINMTSVNYGAPSNQITYTIASSNTYNSFNTVAMTLTDGYSGASATAFNLGVPFQISYLGTSNSVKYTISSSIVGQATQLQITSPNAGESLTINLTANNFNTIGPVIQQINGTGFYICNVIGNGQLPSASLDVVSNVALPAPIAGVDQYVNVTATLGDPLFFINSNSGQIATAVIANSIISAPNLVPGLTAQSFFSGATNQVPSLANYASGFNVALNVPAWVVMADNQSLGIQALGAQHAATASSIPYQRWRRFVTGSQLGELYTTAITNAHNLNEYFCSYFWPGIQATNLITGNNQSYDGLHVAAAAAGIMTGNPVPTPLTNKTLLGNGVEQTTSLANMISLQDSGVLVLNYPTNTKIPTFLSDVTTWQNDNNPANVFNQQVACRFALSYYLNNVLAPYVGTIASTFDEARIGNATKNALNTIIYNGQNGAGILNSWDPRSLVLTFNGSTQTLTIQVSVVFVGQNRFIVVNVTINPLNIQISSQGITTG